MPSLIELQSKVPAKSSDVEGIVQGVLIVSRAVLGVTSVSVSFHEADMIVESSIGKSAKATFRLACATPVKSFSVHASVS